MSEWEGIEGPVPPVFCMEPMVFGTYEAEGQNKRGEPQTATRLSVIQAR